MATSADTAPIIAEARSIVERIQQIDRALDLLAKAPNATESVVSTLAPQDAQGLADLPSIAAHAELRTRREALVQQRAQLKDAFAAHVRQTLTSSLQQLVPNEGGDASTSDGSGQVLNEEGLPFVDPLEILPDSPPQTPQLSAERSTAPTGNVLGRAPGQVAPFHPEHEVGSGQSRKEWMDSIFASLEREEEAELAAATAAEPAAATANAAPSEAHAGEPGKMKAFQRGFLQRRAEKQAQLHPEPSTDAPVRPKKQVRIAAPPSDSDDDDDDVSDEAGTGSKRTASERRSKSVHYGRHPDDVGVEEEAARIVDMLGPQIIEGHPNADRILADLRAEQARMVQRAPPAPTPNEPDVPPKPAIGEAVVERDAGPPPSADAPRTAPRAAPGKKLSAFKQRQLERQGQSSDTSTSPVPTTPRVSHGVPAIERAGRADDSLAPARAQQGLPPQIPHARPTKAYAERLARRRQGAPTIEDPAERVDVAPDVPVAGGRRVRFGAPTVVEPEEMDEEHASYDVPDAPASETEMDDEENPSLHPYEHDSDEMQTDDSDTEGLWDSDDEYTPADLEALKPSMSEHPEDAFWNEQLAKEYAEAKARLSLPATRLAPPPAGHDDDAAESYGIAPLDASLSSHAEERGTSQRSRPRVSQFKAERMAGAPLLNPRDDYAARQDHAGHALAHELRDHEPGTPAPVMVLPSLAPVRYPRPTDEAGAIDLDGESDEDDDRLQELMRARLAIDADSGAPVKEARRAARPPQVQATRKAT
ncbi:hypothetical protein MBRA1_001238 [Malassezia brasiliensis]|uniref:DUF3835 domain-containing protein n=1 Tax=Malassezia brasiliensis TaxID=1821822 RepID=A0AAF0IP70_9BASI|nr:hypothetical protein MBRA1_001238 [Malassezia brasiliensis]